MTGFRVHRWRVSFRLGFRRTRGGRRELAVPIDRELPFWLAQPHVKLEMLHQVHG
ncbi:hypothetical protein ERO13_A07G218750v2 [Gossypium hirsutum]|nr:hypothetical protein ERO13_A07G218750v2 [Gossypium hirsutum]